jgi:Icc-related predicted phosphoesterase
MKLHVLSDLHLEFGNFKPDIETVNAADVIVLAGDIHKGASGLKWARETFLDKPIIYVTGNHEFYGHHWDALVDDLRAQAKTYGINFLENDSVTIEGIRFLGATLWTDFNLFGESRRAQCMRLSESALNDFRLIRAGLPPLGQSELYSPEEGLSSTQDGNRPYVAPLTAAHTLHRHEQTMAWLKAELPNGDPDRTVVISHHYPHERSCAAKWSNDPISSIFGSNLPSDILLGATLWIHGHTHDSCDYRIDEFGRSVRVMCNPRGYPRKMSQSENGNFDPKLLVSID